MKPQVNSIRIWSGKGLSIILLAVILLAVGNRSYGQKKMNFPCGWISLGQVLDTIVHATGLGVGYTRGTLHPGELVRMSGERLSLQQVLNTMLAGRKLQSTISCGTVWIYPKPESPGNGRIPSINVIVWDEDGQPLPGATLRMISQDKMVTTGLNGRATLKVLKLPDTLLCIAVERQTRMIVLSRTDPFHIVMRHQETALTQCVVTAYPDDRRRTQTGSIAFIDDVLMDGYHEFSLSRFLGGQVAGLMTNRTSGVYGASYSILLRGRMSILNGRDPLIVIDGAPYAPNNQSVSNIASGSSAGSLNPLSFLDPAIIESIQVLKDADATAIYGSQGGNGVILITTRQGIQGRTSWNTDVSTGVSGTTRRPRLMDTRQYIAMRREALKNDGLDPNDMNAPDLTLWDTTRNTDWTKYFIRGQSRLTRGSASLTGGGEAATFFLGASFISEANPFISHPSHELFSITGNLQHNSVDKRLRINVNGLLGWDMNRQFTTDLTRLQFFAPNAPDLPSASPLSFIHRPYEARSRNFLAGGRISYRMDSNLLIRSNIGYSSVPIGEHSEILSPGPDAATGAGDSMYHASTRYARWIFEPQLEYQLRFRRWKLSLLAGASFQGSQRSISTISPMGLQRGEVTNELHRAAFAGFNLGWKDRFILHLTGRNDQSNRFGPGMRTGNFGSAAFAWIFSKEPVFRRLLPFVDHGRLRGSYGVTGNDHVDERYRYVNGSLAWENIVKQEVAMDLGLFDGGLEVTTAWYRNRSLNQLLPDILTGAPLYSMTLTSQPVVIQNKGWEFAFTTRIFQNKNWGWTMSLDASLPVNKLVAFPGLTTGTYGQSLTLGQSLTSFRGYRYLGVDPKTGIFQFEDKDGDNRLTEADQRVVGKLDPVFFGGLLNTLRWHDWELSMLIEGRIQQGMNYQTALYAVNPPGSLSPGGYSNQTIEMDNRWHRPGDKAVYQRLTTDMRTPAGQAISNYLVSSAAITNASFARLRSVSLSYRLPEQMTRKMKLRGLRFYLEGEGLFTVTPYKGADPEIQNILILPPARSISAGIQVKF